jgi:hypothetical protein
MWRAPDSIWSSQLGGHNRLGTTRGDAIIAFALPEK